jgi:hypothetical protein
MVQTRPFGIATEHPVKRRVFMKKLTVFLAIQALLFGSIGFSGPALAESSAEQYLGEPEMCVDVHRIKETRILDNQTILFIMRGGNRYLNRLPVKCHGLLINDGFSYELSTSRLCKQDSITALSPGSIPGNRCLLGEFVPFEADMRDQEVVTLLEEGLLETLVSEGAFDEVFPTE